MTRNALVYAVALVVGLLVAAAKADDFVDRPAEIPAAIATALNKIGPIVAPPPTEALYKPLHPPEPYADVKATRDIYYGPDALNRLDLFAPPDPGADKRPVLAFVHGGAFMRGDKRTGDSFAYDNVMLWAVRHGMVGVNLNYRLAPDHPFPAAQQDIDLALAWIRANIAESGGDPGRIFLMGHSAGAAHVAQYAARPELHASPESLAGYIFLSGLFDPATAENNPPLQSYFGKDANAYFKFDATPGLVLSGTPIFLAFAEHDPQDFQMQAHQLQAALAAAGRPPTAYRLLGHSHMSEVYAIDTDDDSLTGPLAAFIAGAK